VTQHKVVTREEWQAARDELLAREKEHTRTGDELARRRRELPWVVVDKEYTFDTDDGPRTLAELFDGRSQLLIYHFMLGPSYEAGCPVCSSSADAVNGVLSHLNARDATMLYVSRAPLPKLQAYKQRMGWSFPWVSSADSDFSFDFGFARTEEETRQAIAPWAETEAAAVPTRIAADAGTDLVGFMTQAPGFLTFVLEDGVVYHTYSTTARGLEFLMGYYPILDRAPKGRDEEADAALWIRRHDEYELRVR
jgi:predicted dithiol-disulfide oxidoreductase (DUF899 family)